MWSETETPTLSIGQLSNYLKRPLREVKDMMEEYWRIKRGQAEALELRAAEIRYKQGPRRVNEEIGDAFPLISQSKFRWLEEFRASKSEKGDRGGSLHSEDSDYTEWKLKRPELEKLRVKLAKTTNKVGYTSPPLVDARLANAAEHGRKERAGRLIFDASRGAWL